MTFIIAPALLATAVVLILQQTVDNTHSVPLWAWVALVLCCDVAHVYATLFRTYLDPQKFAQKRTLLISAPIAAFMGSALVYSLSAHWFWRALAYIAVFHFMRQQYGFMRLYSRQEAKTSTRIAFGSTLDKLTIYMATLYPLLYWHCHLPRNFSWFVDGDFISGLPALAERVGFYLYMLVLAAFSMRTVVIWRNSGFINVPKLLIVLGTACSWYTGIVLLNGDMAFTITNVVAHGIPYMALVWIYQQRDRVAVPAQPPSRFASRSWPGFLLTLALLAYGEEALWNGLVWREFLAVFPVTAWLPVVESHSALSLLVPLLALPQLTHYILDGFIWKTPAETTARIVTAWR